MACPVEPELTPVLPVRHLALLTEFDGSAFNGWQTQARGRTVQQTLLKAVQELTGEKDLRLTGSSRTDSGVHARGHVSHFKTLNKIPADRLPLALNSLLPEDLAVRAACEVAADFHAQYHAKGKIYSYRIWRGRIRPAISRQQLCHLPGPLDLDLIRQAMPYLLGRHDFQSLMDAGSCDRNPVRTIHSLSLEAQGPQIALKVQGDGFLYHMVRIIVGTLVAVGQGKISPDDMPAIIQGKDRKKAGKTMPPQGLCLEQVLYDPPLFDEYFKQNDKEGENHVQFTLE